MHMSPFNRDCCHVCWRTFGISILPGDETLFLAHFPFYVIDFHSLTPVVDRNRGIEITEVDYTLFMSLFHYFGYQIFLSCIQYSNMQILRKRTIVATLRSTIKISNDQSALNVVSNNFCGKLTFQIFH